MFGVYLASGVRKCYNALLNLNDTYNPPHLQSMSSISQHHIKMTFYYKELSTLIHYSSEPTFSHPPLPLSTCLSCSISLLAFLSLSVCALVCVSFSRALSPSVLSLCLSLCLCTFSFSLSIYVFIYLYIYLFTDLYLGKSVC